MAEAVSGHTEDGNEPYDGDRGENLEAFSLDPFAGGTYADKPIWTVGQINANLNRSNYDWYTNNYGELNDGVLNYGFWLNYKELANSYYVNATGSIAFNEAFYKRDFTPFSEGQMQLARESIQTWDDLVAISFRETKSGSADITYGNTFTGGAQAYAYLPFGDVNDDFYSGTYDFDEAGRLSGDVWIDNTVPSNFNPLSSSYYAKITVIHETGHSLGLSHPGDYNATDDNDGDGVPDPITYAGDAFYAQDSRQYTVMSYFDAYETGANHIDWSLMNFAYAATPLIHDVAAIQAIYGADLTTRTGNTVYGFNATAGRDELDFSVNTRPIVTIYDAGGTDKLDFSGWNTHSVIDLNAGSFSSGGGVESFLTLDEINANRAALGYAPRTQATYDAYLALAAEFGFTDGLFTDNISIAYGVTIENAIGGGGDDTIFANNVANRIGGGAGSDTVSYETALTGVSISLESGAIGGRGAAGDRLVSIENLVGSAFNDDLTGNAKSNVLIGGAGNDSLTGGAGGDLFVFDSVSGSGRDSITDFGLGDVIATTQAIADPDGDGIVGLSRSGRIVLDADNGSSVGLVGGDAGDGLRLIGQAGGLFYYELASTAAARSANIDHWSIPVVERSDAGPNPYENGTLSVTPAAVTPADTGSGVTGDGLGAPLGVGVFGADSAAMPGIADSFALEGRPIVELIHMI